MGDTSREPTPEKSYLPVSAPPTNHGHTTAAWVTVTVVMVGALFSSIAFVAGNPALVWTGGGIILVGLVVGAVLRMLGFGQPPAPTRRDAAG